MNTEYVPGAVADVVENVVVAVNDAPGASAVPAACRIDLPRFWSALSSVRFADRYAISYQGPTALDAPVLVTVYETRMSKPPPVRRAVDTSATLARTRSTPSVIGIVATLFAS